MKKYLSIFLLIPLFALGAGCTPAADNSSMTNDTPDSVMQDNSAMENESADAAMMDNAATEENAMMEDSAKSYTMEEVAMHTTEDDCWFVIEGKVYDVSGYGSKHPGGEVVYEGCGKDATSMFESKPGSGKPHSEKANGYLTNFEIGMLK